jgi:thiamine pyrophosphokinase
VKAVIVADGAHAPADRHVLEGADLVIAADGGADWLDAIGVAPDRLVGDLDSADGDVVSRLADSGVAVERHPADKDASDLELAVVAATTAGADELVILGALGGDLDHLAANLLLLGAEAAAAHPTSLVHDRTRARMVRGPGRLTIAAAPGGRVTLLAVGQAADGVTTRGLRWPLDGARLEPGSSRGLANVVVEPSAEVTLIAGWLLVIEIEPDRGEGGER